jgi:hypothetical protein
MAALKMALQWENSRERQINNNYTPTIPGANDEPMCPFICWDFNLANLFSIIRPEGKEEEEK